MMRYTHEISTTSNQVTFNAMETQWPQKKYNEKLRIKKNKNKMFWFVVVDWMIWLLLSNHKTITMTSIWQIIAIDKSP